MKRHSPIGFVVLLVVTQVLAILPAHRCASAQRWSQACSIASVMEAGQGGCCATEEADPAPELEPEAASTDCCGASPKAPAPPENSSDPVLPGLASQGEAGPCCRMELFEQSVQPENGAKALVVIPSLFGLVVRVTAPRLDAPSVHALLAPRGPPAGPPPLRSTVLRL